MSAVLAAGLAPESAGWLARRLPGASVTSAADAGDAASSIRHGGWALVVLADAWAEGAVCRALDAAPPPALLVLGTGGECGAVADARRIPAADRDALLRAARAALDADAPAEPAASPPPAASAPRPPPADALGAAVAGVWERFRPRILARVDAVEAAAVALLEGRLADEVRREAEREAHKLAGAAGTFGYPAASALAREAETLLGRPGALGQGDALRLADLAVSLRRALTAPPPAAAPARPASAAGGAQGQAAEAGAAAEEGPRLLIVEPDRELAERLALEATGRGMRTVTTHDVESARRAAAATEVDAAIVDCSPGEAAPALGLLRALADRDPPVPVVVLTASDAFTDRVEVARLGGRGFLRKPLPPARVLDAVEPLLAPPPGHESVVLAVDDDPAVLDAVRRVLGGAGIRVETLAEPLRFWEALEAQPPDVVLLDVEMPGVDGIDLCRVLRNDPRWKSVPVVFLTARADGATVRRVFDAGADDFVAKPFVGPELSARIHNRLERVRLQRSVAETDLLTGVANRRGSEPVLDRFLRLAAREGDPLAFGLVDLDRFKQVNDRYGHAMGDEVLARVARILLRRFRAEDVVARWGGEEFVVAMFGMDRADGVQRLAEALEVLREERFHLPGDGTFGVTFSAGVAEFPTDGGDVQALYRAADAALYAAKAAGRDRVVPVGWTPGGGTGPRSVDVLVVEDDRAIARLLQHALDTRGYRHEWVSSGEAAARLLAGSPPAVRARVVLLDVDLPGLDGHAVLRALADARVLDRTRVIMLTVRAHEHEVVRALEMGAFDHVAKPFSVPVLLQRVRRALRT